MEFETKVKDNFTILTISGRMDAVTAPEFETKCDGLIQKGSTKMIVDMKPVQYISSAGLRSILSVAKKLKAAGGEIRFCNLEGMVREVFTISGFATMFPVCDSLDQALQSSKE